MKASSLKRASFRLIVCIVAFPLFLASCGSPSPAPAGDEPASDEGSTEDTSTEVQPTATEQSDEEGEGASKRGGVLTVAHQDDAVGLDPHIATSMTSQNIFEQVYSTLVRLDNEIEIEPDLAESWEISEDGTTYTFYLREGVKFHNGREFVGDDVKYSIERIIDLGGPWSARFEVVDQIEVNDPYTVQFHLKEPFAPFIHALVHPSAIVAKEVVEEQGDLQSIMVGTGPFIPEEYEPGNQIRLVRNPEYFEEGLPYIDELVIRFMPDEATRIAALRTGEVDLIPLLDPLNINQLEDEPGIEVDLVDMLARHLILIQTQQPPLDDVRVRQALMLATDRQAVIDTVLAGVGNPTGPFAPGLSAYYVPADELPFSEPNLDRARELLAEAGYPDGFDVTMYAATTYGPHPDMAQVLQQQWERIGVNVKVEVIEWGVLLDHWTKGTFEVITMRYAGYSDPHFDTFDRFHSSSPGNASQFNDPIFDQMAEEAATTLEYEERKELYDELQAYIVEQAPMIFISNAVVGYAMDPAVQGFRGMPNSWISYYKTTWLDR